MKKLKDTRYNKVYIRKWLSDDEREKGKLLRERYFKLNAKYPCNIKDKELYSVINSYIREKQQNCSISFNKDIDCVKLINKKKCANVPNVSCDSDVSDIE